MKVFPGYSKAEKYCGLWSIRLPGLCHVRYHAGLLDGAYTTIVSLLRMLCVESEGMA